MRREGSRRFHEPYRVAPCVGSNPTSPPNLKWEKQMKPTARDFYKQAIEIIASEPDYKRLCVVIAQNSPKVLCTAFESIDATLKNRVMAEYVDNGLVSAIKLYRVETGLGLKESKNFVDATCEHLKAGKRHV